MRKNNLPSAVQYMDIEALVVREIFGMEIYSADDVCHSEFSSNRPYCYKVHNKDMWKLVYPHGSLHVAPARSLDGAYFTCLNAIKKKYKDGLFDCNYEVKTLSTYENQSLSASFVTRFSYKDYKVDLSKKFTEWFHSESLELSMVCAALSLFGVQIDADTWMVKS